ncbi:hypothetical protein BDZ91DRAFT_755778, partial [Kalaharituber pfeilii]
MESFLTSPNTSALSGMACFSLALTPSISFCNVSFPAFAASMNVTFFAGRFSNI